MKRVDDGEPLVMIVLLTVVPSQPPDSQLRRERCKGGSNIPGLSFRPTFSPHNIYV